VTGEPSRAEFLEEPQGCMRPAGYAVGGDLERTLTQAFVDHVVRHAPEQVGGGSALAGMIASTPRLSMAAYTFPYAYPASAVTIPKELL
jgi:hypothetical protein